MSCPPLHPLRALAGAIALGTLLAAAAVPASADDRRLAERPLPVLRVDGTGETAAAPDMAVVTFGVLREAATAREALDANSEAMAAVVDAIRKEGIEARDIQTSGFSISPRYTQPPDSGRIEGEAPRIAGYSVFNNLTVRVRNLAQIGAILDRAVSLGVNSGGDIRFTNSDTAKILAEARKAAVKDAMARAATLAEAAGVKIGRAHV